MIDEAKQQRAIDYIFGELSPADAAAFEKELDQDQELREFTRELTDETASLALATAPISPPRELFSRVMMKTGSRKLRRPTVLSFFPWALAACLAVACLFLGVNDLQTTRLATQLRQRDILSQVRIAALQAQVDTYAKASAIVVWNAKPQRGLLRLFAMPAPEAGHDYQLWIIDPSEKNPVSAGIVAAGKAETASVEFRPVHPVSAAAGFAVSVEKAGGASVPQGPIILAGN
jgi:anti-sigma-K factor RskA